MMTLAIIMLSIAFALFVIVVVLAYGTVPAWRSVALAVAAVCLGQALGRGGE